MQLDRVELADIHNPVALASRVHEQLGPLSSAVPVVKIARALDIADIRLDHFDGFEGMLLTNARRSAGGILANNTKGARRARFTVAHELGHFLMERHELYDEGGFTCSTQDMRETREGRQHLRHETQANQFAIELLAPADLMTPFYSDDPDLRDAQQLRDVLDLSLEACVRRMLSLRDETLAAVWSFEGRVRYSVRSKNFPFVALNKGDRVPQTSAAFRAITKAQPGFTRFVETDALPWAGRSDLELCEQTRVAASGHAALGRIAGRRRRRRPQRTWHTRVPVSKLVGLVSGISAIPVSRDPFPVHTGSFSVLTRKIPCSCQNRELPPKAL